ncbi:MAG: SMUG2 DNA glycosylase family protein [Schleiferiaceae bacterium]
MLNQDILSFYNALDLDLTSLLHRPDLDVLNPYEDQEPEIKEAFTAFYKKYYADSNARGLILGINPGRKGAGVTGIPFTDTKRLESFCGIALESVKTHEPSSVFVYEVIEAYGGVEKFYADFFIGAISPLGYVQRNEKNHWVNYNFYDEAPVEKALLPFIVEQLKNQKALCQNPRKTLVLGSGKNVKALNKINDEHDLFDEIYSVEHPRYIMQYKAKTKSVYIDKYLNALNEIAPKK